MKILVVGATGTIGSGIVQRLGSSIEVITASQKNGALPVDLSDPDSIKRMCSSLTDLNAIVCAVGVAAFAPLLKLSDSDYEKGLRNKLMGQVNLVRYGLDSLVEGGSITLTGGIASRQPFESGGALISMCNAGLEGFVRAAARELPRNIRLNIVAPGWVRETLVKLKMDPSKGIPVMQVAERYIDSIEGKMTGQVIDAV